MTTKEGAERRFEIAHATVDDADDILFCLRAAFEPYRQQYTPDAYDDTVMTADTVRERIHRMTVLVARTGGGAIVGTIGGVVRSAEGHIRGMAVIPAAQGAGVADLLLGSIEHEMAARGCSYLTLDTTAPLVRAIRFYERNGYVRSGAVNDFFGMPLYEYHKWLQPDSSTSSRRRS